jgi:hypothetical protein
MIKVDDMDLSLTKNNLTEILKETRAITATPGISGVLFRLNIPLSHRQKDADSWRHDSWLDRTGYTTENRLAFLEKEGVDPIDITKPYQVGMPVRMAFFNPSDYEFINSLPPGKDYHLLWSNFLLSQAKELDALFFTSLAQSRTQIPFYSEPLSKFIFRSYWDSHPIILCDKNNQRESQLTDYIPRPTYSIRISDGSLLGADQISATNSSPPRID